MQIGYARVSTEDQSLVLQHDALKASGCERVFDDHVSGMKANRPGLDKALELLREGDTLVVWRLDRLGRSLKDLISRAEELKGHRQGFPLANQTPANSNIRPSAYGKVGRNDPCPCGSSKKYKKCCG